MNTSTLNKQAIDKAKGIIAKPMPRAWFDRHAAAKTEDSKERERSFSLLADKKPYFMRYIYPALMKEYNSYTKSTNISSLRRFGVGVNELKAKEADNLSDEERNFIRYYDRKMPVGTGDCVMNRICRRFEEEFDSFSAKASKEEFDYSIMKSGMSYTKAQFYAVKEVYEEYQKRIKENKQISCGEDKTVLKEEFSRKCDEICPNRKVLCDIVLDLCYKTDSGKAFAWDICGEEIVDNLLEISGRVISVPVQSENGSIYYGGKHFEIKEVVLGNEYSAE